jgi:peptide/nickel transport system permease protein
MLMIYAGVKLRLLPISGHIPVIDPLMAGQFDEAINNFPNAVYHLMMPGITVGVFSLSRNARLIRSSMLEVLSQDYVTTARAKGLKERTVIFRHAFRNALIPVVTIFGLEFGFLLSGVVVTETVFRWPGVGRLVYNAINQRDIPLVQAAVVMFSFIFVGLNLVVDMLYARLDPRVRLR